MTGFQEGRVSADIARARTTTPFLRPLTLPVDRATWCAQLRLRSSDFTLKLRDWESHLARAKWVTERDSFHTAYDVSEIRFTRNGNFGVSVGVIFMRILGAGMLLPRR